MRAVRFVRSARYPIELVSCKENVRRNVRYLIELRVVRRMLEGIKVLIELRAVRSLLEGFQGIRLS